MQNILNKKDYPIGIVTAFKEEIEDIIIKLSKRYPDANISGRKYILGKIHDKFVVVVLSGIGMTNAAMTTQQMIDVFNPKFIIFSGVSGGIDPRLRTGDVAIATKWAQYQHQKMIDSQDKFNGFQDEFIDFPNKFYSQNGIIPSFLRPDCTGCNKPTNPINGKIIDNTLYTPNFSIPMFVDTFTRPNDAYKTLVPQKFWMDVNSTLLRIAAETINNITIPFQIKPDKNDPSTWYTPIVRQVDSGLSSSTFMDNEDYANQLHSVYKSSIIDMESAAIGHVAVSNSKPFIVIRAVSDLVNSDFTPDIISSFLQNAAQISTFVLFEYIQHVPSDLWSKREPCNHCVQCTKCAKCI